MYAIVDITVVRFLMPPIIAGIFFAARIAELTAKRRRIKGKIIDSKTLRYFVWLGFVVIIFSFLEYIIKQRSVDPFICISGIVGAIIAFRIRRGAIRALGEMWSLNVEIRDEHRLIRHGPYRWVRHPTYLSMIIELVSFCAIIDSWFALAILMIPYLAVLLIRVRVEEASLIRASARKGRISRKT